MNKISKTSLALSLGLLHVQQVLAQDGNQPAAQQSYERITVTGSRVLRTEEASAAPVQVFTCNPPPNGLHSQIFTDLSPSRVMRS